MGKKNKGEGNLGKALIRDRFNQSRNKRYSADQSQLHTVNVNDGYDWARLNPQSVTEETSFQEFLSTAELAGTEFQAEKLNIKFVNPKTNIGLLTKEEKQQILHDHEENKAVLKVPRRPKWDESMTAEELHNKEKEGFLEWRRQLACFQETQNLILTPYEKNLEFWRQLWRVLERSDVVVQIVDARNPLLFRCEDLENYVKEIDQTKMNLILINKADFLTEKQRKSWSNYFKSIDVQVVFFSALLSSEKESNDIREETIYENDDSENDENSNDEESIYCSEFASESEYETAEDSTDEDDHPRQEEYNDRIKSSSRIMSRMELISFFKHINERIYKKDILTIGLVGHPNVGKSSTINTLLMDKKVSVSATPGKTKHFQTLFLDKSLLLCDCPGLVMPSFVCTKAEMILNGILPIDQMRDHVPPVTLVGTLIPKHIIEDLYGIMLPLPLEGEDPDRPPTSEEILNTYGYSRGFMTQNGQPDNPRSSRYILKDFVNGKLLYCVSPPTTRQEEFHIFPSRRRVLPDVNNLPPRTRRVNKANKITGEDLDEKFFSGGNTGTHTKGVYGKPHGIPQNLQSNGSMQNLTAVEKPWKKINKHANKKKREKTRRLYAHLDRH